MPDITPDPLNPKRRIVQHPQGPQHADMPIAEALSCEQITRHFEKYLGNSPLIFHELMSKYVHLDLVMFPPTESEPYHTIVTSGMSDKPMTGATERPFMELLIRLPAHWKMPVAHQRSEAMSDQWYWPLHMIKFMARYPHQFGTYLNIGHTMQLVDGDDQLIPGSPFEAAVIHDSLSLPGELTTLEISPEKTIRFAAIYPAFARETRYARMKSTRALMDLLVAHGVTDILDAGRKSVVGDHPSSAPLTPATAPIPSKPAGLLDRIRYYFRKR